MRETFSSAREARNTRLNTALQTAIQKRDFDGIVKNRFALLGYSYSEDDSGGGSALASITAAAATLGSSYILSQQPNNGVNVPTRTNPAYGATAPTSTGTIFLVVGVLAVLIGGAVFVMRG